MQLQTLQMYLQKQFYLHMQDLQPYIQHLVQRRVSVREARPENAYERQNEGFRQVVFEFKTQDEPAKCSAWFCESITIEK